MKIQKMLAIELKPGEPITSELPQCELCHAILRFPNQLAFEDGSTLLVDRKCFQLVMVLSRLAHKGHLSITETENRSTVAIRSAEGE